MTTINSIIEYVLYTPWNPNRAVLKSMLEAFLEDNGGGGGGTVLDKKIIILPSSNGETTFSPEEPNPGDTVTITATPDAGYVISKVVVVDLDGKEIPLTDIGNGKYTYVQPANGSSVVPLVDYDTFVIGEDDTVIFDGGGPSGW